MGGDIVTKRSGIHIPSGIGDVLADGIASTMGSWTFIVVQTVIVAVWMTLNAVAWARHWDPEPYILLNLIFSTQAAYASPIILMSQNRQSKKDRVRDDVEAEEVNELHAINKRQLIILELLQRHITGDPC